MKVCGSMNEKLTLTKRSEWNDRLEQLSQKHPWLKDFIWKFNLIQKPRLIHSTK